VRACTHLKLCCLWVADSHCPAAWCVLRVAHVVKVLCARAQGPGQDLCVACQCHLLPQQLRQLVQRQLTPLGDCAGDLWGAVQGQGQGRDCSAKTDTCVDVGVGDVLGEKTLRARLQGIRGECAGTQQEGRGAMDRVQQCWVSCG
jgi:hypothetical protein